jgi:hypothetical protein
MGGVYQGNKDAFYSNPNYDADRKQMQEAYDVMANREAPTAQAASMSDPSIAAAQGSAQTAQQSNVGSAFDRAAAQSNQYAQTQAAQAQAAKVQGANTNQAATQLGWVVKLVLMLTLKLLILAKCKMLKHHYLKVLILINLNKLNLEINKVN